MARKHGKGDSANHTTGGHSTPEGHAPPDADAAEANENAGAEEGGEFTGGEDDGAIVKPVDTIEALVKRLTDAPTKADREYAINEVLPALKATFLSVETEIASAREIVAAAEDRQDAAAEPIAQIVRALKAKTVLIAGEKFFPATNAKTKRLMLRQVRGGGVSL